MPPARPLDAQDARDLRGEIAEIREQSSGIDKTLAAHLASCTESHKQVLEKLEQMDKGLKGLIFAGMALAALLVGQMKAGDILPSLIKALFQH